MMPPTHPTSVTLVLKFILVLVFVSFSLNHFYFYIISIFSATVILVFISFYTNHSDLLQLLP